MTRSRGARPSWSVCVFSDKAGLCDEWSFKLLSTAMRFAKRQLKKGFGVTIQPYDGMSSAIKEGN